MNKAQKRLLFLLGFWLALIFITSCFVVPFATFVSFVQGWSSSMVFKQWFAQFWLISWVFIVKGWHTTEYALLTVFATLALQSVRQWNRRKSVRWAFVFAVLFAASDEWHQTFVSGRDGCVRDVVIDSLGALLAALFLLRGTRKKEA